MRRVAIFTLLTLGAIPKAPAEPPDAPTILKRSQDAIANLKTFEIKGFMVIETSNANYEQTLKSKLVLASEQPGKFRVDVRTPGATTIVADGTQTWTFNPMLMQYTKSVSSPSLVNALQSGPANLLLPNPPGQTVKSVKLTGEADLDLEGARHPCYLLDVESASSKFSKFWIDKSTWLVLKRTSEEHFVSLPPSGIPADMKMSVQVESMTVNQPLSAELFTFIPPAGSKLVDKFGFSGMTSSNLTGKHAIDFKFKDLSDHEFQLANYKGKTVLLDFWATWCGPCRAEIPVLNKLHQDNPELVVLGIDVGEDADVVRKFVKENNLTYPILLAGQDGVVNDYAAHSLPTVVVIDKDGDIRSYKVGYDRGGDEQLRLAVIEAGKPKPTIGLAQPAVPGPGGGIISAVGSGPYRIGGGVSAPNVLYKRDPAYSEEARKAKISGTVSLSVVVSPDGIPRDIKVLRSLGYGLDEKAIETVKDWRFKPGMKDGVPVAVMANIEVNFRLLDGPPAQNTASIPASTDIADIAVSKTPEEGYRRAIHLIQTRHPDEGIALLSQVLAVKPDWTGAYIARAHVEYQQKRYTEAIRDYDQAIRLDPKCAPCYDTRGLAYSYSGRHTRAIEDYARAIALNPAAAIYYANRGWAYTSIEKPDKAIEDLTKAIQMAPYYLRAYENRALSYTQLQDWPHAIADYAAALELNPTRWQYEKRAEAKRAAGDEAGAAQDMQRAAQMPNIPVPTQQ